MLSARTIRPDRMIISSLVLFILAFISYALAANRVYAASCQSAPVTYIRSSSLTVSS
jgi:hypothetical protein